jgi:hypothetical protein
MKRTLSLTILVGLAGVNCLASDALWQPLPGEVEFSITSDVSGVSVESPKALEGGYNGAWWFGDFPYNGIAQTFTVDSSRLMKSATLRLGGFDFRHASGQIEIALVQFDTATQIPVSKLGSIVVNASSYQFDLLSVPRSSFNFSSFGIILNPQNTYAVVVLPTATFTGGLMTLQAATDIYPGGSAYSVSFLTPEPSSATLVLICSIASIPIRRRKPTSHNCA